MNDGLIGEIKQAATVLFRPGDVVEVRVPKADRFGVISGFFSDFERMYREIARLEAQKFPGVYWTLNPVHGDTIARENSNQARRCKPDDGAKDKEILCRRWLIVDFDPKRLHGISSTQAEHDAAFRLADQVHEALLLEGWGEAVRADSGNGAHLLYRIELDNDDATRTLIQSVLNALAARFGTAEVDVDRTMFNASRIAKIYGTTARKGSDTPDRPHRRSRLLYAPAEMPPVPVALLRAMAATAPQDARRAPDPHPQGRYTGPREPFDLAGFLSRHGIAHRGARAYEGGYKYVLENCPFDSSHKAPDSAVFELAGGALAFKCLHNSCADRDWRQFRERFEGPRPVRSFPVSRSSAAAAVPARAPEPEREPESDGRDKTFPLTLLDVEAAADAAIAAKSSAEVMRLAPAIVALRKQHQAVVVAKLRDGFKDEWKAIERWFDKALKDAEAERKETEEAEAPPPAAPPSSSDTTGGYPDLLGYPYTDAGNGERIVALFGEDIRYCLEFKKWLVWDERRWKVDEADLLVRHKAKEMARILYLQALGRSPVAEKHARASESLNGIKAAVSSAAAEKGIAISVRELDQHPYLLNVPNGVLDLSGAEPRLLPHDRKFLITKMCPVPYVPSAECPNFMSFVEWTMSGNDNPDAEMSERAQHLMEFMQRLLGSALTGDVSDKAFFVFHGVKGNNGKTTLLTLMRRILGSDYACKILVETILVSIKGADATARADLADLRGMRLVVTSEINKETKLDEALMKRITAGLDSIKTCRKYENPFEFDPTHKLVMDANYRPKIVGTDDAIWNRLKLLPFEHQRERAKQDKDLPDKLFAEAKGVLAWLVRGCMAWRKQGLGEPPEIVEAGQNWRRADDTLREFLEDCCEFEEEYFVTVRDMAAAYDWWCRQNRERFPIGRSNFIERLEARGLKRDRDRIDGVQSRVWKGVQLITDVTAEIRRFDTRGSSRREDDGG